MNGPTSRGLCAASPMTPKRRLLLLPLRRFRPVAVLGVTGVAGLLAVAMGGCEPWFSFTPFAPRGLPEDLREDYVQPHVGHYGVFNGRRFREEIYPRVAAFVARQEARIAVPAA